MGCWNETCIISHLPIKVGDEVIWLLLQDSSYGDEVGKTGCYHTDFWVPRCIPIRAYYDDYGSIENWETGVIVDSMLAQFQKDLIVQELDIREKTLGFKPLTLEDMTMYNLLSHLREGDVIVNRNIKHPKESKQPVHVVQVLILASIWDRLCETKRYNDWSPDGEGLNTISDYKVETDPFIKTVQEDDAIKELKGMIKSFYIDRLVSFQERYQSNPYDQFLDLIEAGLSDENKFKLGRRVQELRIINEHLACSRSPWTLTIGSGSQASNLVEHTMVHLISAELAIEEKLKELVESNEAPKRQLDQWKSLVKAVKKLKKRIEY